MSVALAVQRHRREQLDRALLELLSAYVQRAPLFAGVRARGAADDVVQDALIAVGRKLDGGDAVADPHAYATRVCQNLARRVYISGSEEPIALADTDAANVTSNPSDIAVQRDELAAILEMAATVQGVLAQLDDVAFEIVRGELAREDQKAVAARLGLPRATFYRRKRRAAVAFVAAVAERSGTAPCPDRREGLLAAAAGSRFAAACAAREHAKSCPGCADTLRHLATARHGLGLIAPMPALIVAAPCGGVTDRIGALVHGALEWGRAAAVRGADPSFTLPSRAVAAAAAAACVGVGGSTYCAVEGLPSLAHGEHPHHRAAGGRHAQHPTPATAFPHGATTAQPQRSPHVTTRRGPVSATQSGRHGAAHRDDQATREFASDRRSGAEGEFTPASHVARASKRPRSSSRHADHAKSNATVATSIQAVTAAPQRAATSPSTTSHEFGGGTGASEFGG